MVAKKLYLLQIEQDGIPDDVYHFLPEGEQKMLVEKGGRFYLRDEHRKKLKVVLTGGAFDVLHIGHLFTLSEAKKYGDVLVVAVAKDEHIKKKGREPIHSLEYRKMMVGAMKMVDMAIGGFEDPKKMLKLVQPQVIVYGYDQKEFLKPEGVQVVKLERKIDDSKFKSGKILESLGL
ncbi:MAG TPA: adenylyltransferase/cytidyltransferase family protein [Candidatus Bilamarchaeum sp.]|nr:adenylyltransferase/cytidyltransferase family protein [Candidatus Bilamarchaeum sp.]